jgi:serine protease inhibitor
MGMRLNRLFGFGSAIRDPAVQDESLVEGSTAFALDLYAQLKGRAGNLFFSPHSISTCLAMTYAGARGETERQMSRVLHFSKDQGRLHAAFGELLRQLEDAKKEIVIPGLSGGKVKYAVEPAIQLSIANALWAQEGHPFLPAFLEIATGNYQANVKQANFKTEAAAATGEINRWVAAKTKDKIQNIVPPGSVDELTRLALANAVYFKGAWAEPFEETATTTQSFHLSNTREIDARLMHQTAEFKYTENKDFQAVELPYNGQMLSMVILLPRRIDDCGDLENQLTPALLSSCLAKMKTKKVEVFLPRFELESSFDLSGTLSKMGMPDAFRWPGADFSGLDGIGGLFISGLFHKAWGEINERGTEAAAVTACLVAGLCQIDKPPPPPPVFRADHPFIFLIRDIRSGCLLFAGRLADPRG